MTIDQRIDLAQRKYDRLLLSSQAISGAGGWRSGEFNDSRRYLKKAKKNLKALKRLKEKNKGEIEVSDHTIVRYLERIKGVDVESIKSEIKSFIGQRFVGDAHYPINSDFVLVVRNNTIITISPKSTH